MENSNKPSKETQERWSNDPNNWIWDIFYYNKDDKRLLPPKRNALMGWTVNFANTNSVFLFALLMLIVFILILN